MPDREKVIEGLEMSYRYSNVDESNTLVPQQLVLDTLALLKAQEQRHRLEVHNIGNIDVPEGVTWEQFQAVMSGVVKALEHTDRGESWPYDEGGGEVG